MITRRTALARARRGAKFLDEKRPRWRRKVDAERVNMHFGYYELDGPWHGCILTQVGATRSRPGEYGEAARSFGLDPVGHEAQMLGFYVVDETEYEELTSAWLKVLDEVTS